MLFSTTFMKAELPQSHGSCLIFTFCEPRSSSFFHFHVPLSERFCDIVVAYLVPFIAKQRSWSKIFPKFSKEKTSILEIQFPSFCLLTDGLKNEVIELRHQGKKETYENSVSVRKKTVNERRTKQQTFQFSEEHWTKITNYLLFLS